MADSEQSSTEEVARLRWAMWTGNGGAVIHDPQRVAEIAAGYIARDYTYTFRRATSNGSLGVGWKPLIHSHKEKALSATN